MSDTKGQENEFRDNLNQEQRTVFNAIMNARRGDVLNIQGVSGSGKTYMIKAVLTQLGYDFTQFDNSRKREVEVCAYTGVAAHLYGNNAITLHQFLARYCDIAKIWREYHPFQEWCIKEYPAIKDKPGFVRNTIASNMLVRYFDTLFDDNAEDSQQIGKIQQEMLDTITLVELPKHVIIDESSMCPRMFARVIIKNSTTTRLIFIGDRHQIPPVISSNIDDISGMMYVELPPTAKYLRMDTVMRQRNDAQTEILQLLRNIILNKDTSNPDAVYQKQLDVYNLNVKLIGLYNQKTPEVIITPTNKEKDELNRLKMAQSRHIITLLPDVVLRKPVDFIISKVDWVNRGVREKEKERGDAKDDIMKEEWVKDIIKDHYLKTMAAAVVHIPVESKILNLVNIRQTFENVTKDEDGNSVTEKERAMCPNGGVGNIVLRDNSVTEYSPTHYYHNETTKKDVTYKESEYEGLRILYEGRCFDIKGKAEAFHSSTKDYFYCIKPGIQMYFAMTYHKTQGLTFDFPYEIRVNKFHLTRCPGLAYVAITRATDFSNIRVAGECFTAEMFDYPITSMDKP